VRAGHTAPARHAQECEPQAMHDWMRATAGACGASHENHPVNGFQHHGESTTIPSRIKFMERLLISMKSD